MKCVGIGFVLDLPNSHLSPPIYKRLHITSILFLAHHPPCLNRVELCYTSSAYPLSHTLPHHHPYPIPPTSCPDETSLIGYETRLALVPRVPLIPVLAVAVAVRLPVQSPHHPIHASIQERVGKISREQSGNTVLRLLRLPRERQLVALEPCPDHPLRLIKAPPRDLLANRTIQDLDSVMPRGGLGCWIRTLYLVDRQV